jgi:hypothetical protein
VIVTATVLIALKWFLSFIVDNFNGEAAHESEEKE